MVSTLVIVYRGHAGSPLDSGVSTKRLSVQRDKQSEEFKVRRENAGNQEKKVDNGIRFKSTATYAFNWLFLSRYDKLKTGGI